MDKTGSKPERAEVGSSGEEWYTRNYTSREYDPKSKKFRTLRSWHDERKLKEDYRTNYDRIFGKDAKDVTEGTSNDNRLSELPRQK